MVKPLRKVYYVEYHNEFFGESEQLKEFTTYAEARAYAAQCNRESRAIDDPEDKIRYTVGSYIAAPVNPHEELL